MPTLSGKLTITTSHFGDTLTLTIVCELVSSLIAVQMKKSIFYNYSVIECGKRVKYFYWVKKDLFGCFKIEENVTTTMKQV